MTNNNKEKICGLASQCKNEETMVNKMIKTARKMLPPSFCINLKRIEYTKEMSRPKKMTTPVSPNDW